ncbi:MAG: YgaP family membrane protein [Acidimicrobiales bacterium]
MKFAQFMSSATGRLVRIVAGIALIVIGLIAGGGWVVLSVVGLIPLIAGLANVCLIAPLFGEPLKGH